MATVGLVYNLAKEEVPEDGEPPDIYAEYDSEDTILAVASALRRGGHDVVPLEGDIDSLQRLISHRVDVVFNMAEGVAGESRESHVPAFLEMLQIPYTGSGVLSLALSLNKPMAKKVFTYHGIPTPRFLEVGARVSDEDAMLLVYPLFVKPALEGSSIGITPDCIVHDLAALRQQVSRLFSLYRQNILIEEYLPGREFTVALLGNDPVRTLSPMEIHVAKCPSDHGQLYSRRFKADWSAQDYFACPAPIDESMDGALRELAIRAYQALNCRDLARVDIRLDAAGIPHVMEVNPLPGLAPGYSDFPRIAETEGIGYVELVNAILDHALLRYGRHDLRLMPQLSA